MNKNDLYTLTIESLGNEGEGIGKLDGFPLFVKDALPGDVIEVKVLKVKKTYGYGRMMKLLKPSPERIEPPCPLHRSCGGCQIQALDYGKQLEFKENKVKNNLTRIGGFQLEEAACESGKELPVIHPAMGMEEPYHYRNKAQFPIGTDKNGNIVTGFYAARSHTIIPNRNCFLGVKLNEEILNLVIEFMEENGIAP